MKIRFFNARILTMEKGKEPFLGELRVKDDKIEKILREEDKVASSETEIWDEEIDCGGNLLMPGFKNAHTHSPMTFLRSYADDLPLNQWLYDRVFPMEAKLSDEAMYEFARLAVLEYLAGGITSVFDMYLKPELTAKACMDMGMRCVLVSGLNDFTSSPKQMEEEYNTLNHFSPLIQYRLGFHAEYTCSRALLEQVSQLSHKYETPVYCHLSETEKEVSDCRKKYGMTPTVFLDSLGIFDYGGGGYHCVYMSEEDLAIFQKQGLYVVTNPASNLKLASGIAPIAEFEKRGIPVAIGTDGAASNNCLDMFREMFLVSGLSKVLTKDAASTDACDVLRMATVNGSLAMGIPETDVLSEGKLADLILIDLNQPNMHPFHNIPKNLVYSGNKGNILLTMINGNILYRDGRYPGVDAQEIYFRCEELLKRM